jgi:hypothetical protein
MIASRPKTAVAEPKMFVLERTPPTLADLRCAPTSPGYLPDTWCGCSSSAASLIRWAVALQVRRRDGPFRDIVRYDDWHGPLHRHRAPFAPRKPDPMEEPPPRVSPIRYAVGDILINADVLLAVAQKDDEL